jgi:hypothetical protein
MRTWERLKHRHDHCKLSSFTTEKTEAGILMGGGCHICTKSGQLN